ncbi:hypothetical protein HK102_004165 [Quaeritorhiza haematococci]|nr:hypothetical protein HK102_004165 [Quaeritorhiza haematococci]
MFACPCLNIKLRTSGSSWVPPSTWNLKPPSSLQTQQQQRGNFSLSTAGIVMSLYPPVPTTSDTSLSSLAPNKPLNGYPASLGLGGISIEHTCLTRRYIAKVDSFLSRDGGVENPETSSATGSSLLWTVVVCLNCNCAAYAFLPSHVAQSPSRTSVTGIEHHSAAASAEAAASLRPTDGTVLIGEHTIFNSEVEAAKKSPEYSDSYRLRLVNISAEEPMSPPGVVNDRFAPLYQSLQQTLTDYLNAQRNELEDRIADFINTQQAIFEQSTAKAQHHRNLLWSRIVEIQLANASISSNPPTPTSTAPTSMSPSLNNKPANPNFGFSSSFGKRPSSAGGSMSELYPTIVSRRMSKTGASVGVAGYGSPLSPTATPPQPQSQNPPQTTQAPQEPTTVQIVPASLDKTSSSTQISSPTQQITNIVTSTLTPTTAPATAEKSPTTPNQSTRNSVSPAVAPANTTISTETSPAQPRKVKFAVASEEQPKEKQQSKERLSTAAMEEDIFDLEGVEMPSRDEEVSPPDDEEDEEEDEQDEIDAVPSMDGVVREANSGAVSASAPSAAYYLSMSLPIGIPRRSDPKSKSKSKPKSTTSSTTSSTTVSSTTTPSTTTTGALAPPAVEQFDNGVLDGYEEDEDEEGFVAPHILSARTYAGAGMDDWMLRRDRPSGSRKVGNVPLV